MNESLRKILLYNIIGWLTVQYVLYQESQRNNGKLIIYTRDNRAWLYMSCLIILIELKIVISYVFILISRRCNMSQDYTHEHCSIICLFFFFFYIVVGVFILHAQRYDGGNVTLSQLSVQLTPDDDGQKLVCRAENSALGLASASAIEDTWLLDVYCEYLNST